MAVLVVGVAVAELVEAAAVQRRVTGDKEAPPNASDRVRDREAAAACQERIVVWAIAIRSSLLRPLLLRARH